MLLILSLACVGAAVYFLGEAVTVSSRQKEASLRRAAGYGRARAAAATGAESLRFRERVVTPAIGRLAAITLKLNPRSTHAAIGARLLTAGLAARISPTTFLAVKAGSAIGGVLFGFFLGVMGAAGFAILLAPAFGVLGFLAPDSILNMQVKRRREQIRADLPDALDLLAVSVEAGLGFDGAISKLTEHMSGPLVSELGIALNEMRIGEGRVEALKKLAERVPAPEVSAFVRAIVQADQLGISMGRILRVQAADSRLRRQAAAEERAMKAPIKMLFPTGVFIFPSMFIVILGPALINILQAFK
jgi:tight adherence protein C